MIRLRWPGGETASPGDVYIGRDPDCDVVVAEPGVSYRHAKVENVQGTWFLTDLGSTNGTLLDGQPLTSRTPLRDGATITIADVAITVTLTAAGSAVAPEPPAPTEPVVFAKPAPTVRPPAQAAPPVPTPPSASADPFGGSAPPPPPSDPSFGFPPAPPPMPSTGVPPQFAPIGSRAARFGARIVDGIALFVPALVFGIIGAETLGGIVFLLCWLGYHPAMMARPGDQNGQTLGKQLVGVRVVRDDGQPMDIGAGFMRELVGVLLPSLFTCSVYGLVDAAACLFDSDRKLCLHDRIAHTRVVTA